MIPSDALREALSPSIQIGYHQAQDGGLVFPREKPPPPDMSHVYPVCLDTPLM